MFRKILIVIAATTALGAGMASMASTAEAHHRHHHGSVGFGFFPAFGFFPGMGYSNYGYPGFGYRHYGYGYSDYNDDYGCGYRRVTYRKWNRSHTHLIVVHRMRQVCY